MISDDAGLGSSDDRPAGDPRPDSTEAALGSADDRRARDRLPDTTALECWPTWQDRAWKITRPKLDRRKWRFEREGKPGEFVNYVAYCGFTEARDTFDASRGAPFDWWLRTKIDRQIEELERQCRHDHRSKATCDLPARPDSTDAIAANERTRQVREAMRRALEVVPEDDHPVVFAMLDAIDQPGHRRYIITAAESLGWSVVDTDNAWQRVRHHVRRAFPEGRAAFGL